MKTYPTSLARPIPLGIAVFMHMEISLARRVRSCISCDRRTFVFCSWSRKSEGTKSRERGFPSAYGYICTVTTVKFLSICHLLRWIL